MKLNREQLVGLGLFVFAVLVLIAVLVLGGVYFEWFSGEVRG
jgi:hypothetical protein